ncbi:hypothetical protein [Occallatibacter riparius]|uniref:Uncharacterized protein n=1 Tax=Occallatibacter riparius TaxID=1002689 RepID=A0A9J7BGM0_9BACT|nr:hypothetical protein [Occallatibacter riparius]UWZ82124.1 hypothetical protein MOP44_16260 [Occallatibacter riparius]
MRSFSLRLFLFALMACAFAAPRLAQAQGDPAFHWVDFRSDADQSVIVWVTRALSSEKWTAIREIGVLYDAALVVTTERSAPDALPSSDTFQLWSVNLTTKLKTPLLKGVNLRWVDWLELREGSPRELAALYDDCRDCAVTTYFTAFHYDYAQHIIAARWIRGGQTVPVWGTAPAGVDLTQMYAVLAQPDGQQYLATWLHYDYGKQKSPDDYVYRFGVNPFNGVEQTAVMTRKEGEELKPKLCAAQNVPQGMSRGQDSQLCDPFRAKAERRPTTTPPANAQGRSVPPGSHPAPKK